VKPGITRSMRTWRKFHRFTFGYSKWVSLISVSLLMIISITGILLIHQDDRQLMDLALEHAAVYGLQTEASPAPTRELVGDEKLSVGELSLQVIHTPGHSPGGICLYVEDCLLVGDTLFAGSIGRTDLPGGDHQLLISGIKAKLLPLPDATRVCPGHGPMTTIGEEKQHNPFLR